MCKQILLVNFSTVRFYLILTHAVIITLDSSGSRPYLPYRGDHLSPGQQVKVLAPGGGVAVARVVTNQRSALVSSNGYLYGPQRIISPASVTVVLMTEPNR